MRDIRKKVLIESGKKTSRKARARPASLAGSAAQSPSPTSSPGRSNAGSRQASRANSRPGSRYASEDEDGISDADYGRLNRLTQLIRSSADSDSDDSDEDSDTDRTTERWQDMFQECLKTLQDRKRSSAQGRVETLKAYVYLARNQYAGSHVGDALPTILEQLLKSIRRGGSDGDEKKLALEALAVTTLSCPNKDASGVLDSVFGPVKNVCTDPESNDACKVAAIQALGVAVLFGGGTSASADELFEFLLDIIGSDGQSVDASDSAAVVTAALQMWTFVASYMMPEGGDSNGDEIEQDSEDENENGSGMDNDDALHSSLVTESQNALEVFVDQLDSTDTDVQAGAAVALGLLFEASRKFQSATGKPLHLTQDPLKLAQRMRDLARGAGGSTKSTSRRDRRTLRETVTSVATSLELGRGPKYATAGRPRNNPHASGMGIYADEDGEATTDDLTAHTLSSGSDTLDAFGYRERLQVGSRYLTIDNWAMSVRVDTLRALLGSGLQTHLSDNALVSDLLSAASLQRLASDLARDHKKSIKEIKSKKFKSGR